MAKKRIPDLPLITNPSDDAAAWIYDGEETTKDRRWRVANIVSFLTTRLSDIFTRRDNNLSDVQSAPASRDNLGLGTAATRDVTTSNTDTDTNHVMRPGNGGILSNAVEKLDDKIPSEFRTIFARIGNMDGTVFASAIGLGDTEKSVAYINISYASDRSCGIIIGQSSLDAWVYRDRPNIGDSGSAKLYSTANTTVDSNGFIKEASPIIKLYADRIESNTDQGKLKIVGTGHYEISGTLGFADEGWFIENPKDANGNIKRFVKYSQDNGVITIQTSMPDYSQGYAAEGEPADIPEGRFITLRLNAPENKEVGSE